MSGYTQDERLMWAAISLAQKNLGQTWPNPSVGCVVVQKTDLGDVIVGTGITAKGGRPHAETQALAQAGIQSKGASVYVTLEPCAHVGETPSCASALIEAQVAKVFIGLQDPDERTAGKGVSMLQEAGIEVVCGVLEQNCHYLTLGHVRKIEDNRPFISMKLSQSADGFVAGEEGVPIAITGARTNAYMHALRAKHDAIMVGQTTVLRDNPQLNVRLKGMESFSPLRIILDKNGRIDQTYKVFSNGKSWRVIGAGYALKHKVTNPELETITCQLSDDGRICLTTLLGLLSQRGLTRILVEAGPRLCQVMLGMGLVDEFYFTQSATKIGNGLKGLDVDEINQLTRFAGLLDYESFTSEEDVVRIFRKQDVI